MIALDTNILARLLLRDDARQHDRARARLARESDYTAPITVMQELVWVLEVNDCGRDDIAHALRMLLGLPNFKPQQPEVLCLALDWYARGLDFADALHLALSRDCEELATFDKGYAKRSRKLALVPPVRVV